MPMEVSIIVPTYNPGLYLFDCLNSVLAQDFNHDRFELVVVLNGEKEPFYNSIEAFLKTKIINYKLLFSPLKGVSNARNYGLDRINSKYVVFLDDDDILSMNFISSLYSSITSNSIVNSNVKTFTTDLNILGEDYISRCFNRCSKKRKYSLVKYRGFLSSVCAKMIPMVIINSFRFDNHLYLGEDAVFMFLISCNINQIRLTDNNATYYRRLRDGSASRKKQPIHIQLNNLFKSLWKYSAIYFSKPFKYDLGLYISRLAASIKCFLFELFA
jgi:glycosyltransferase involved in cell wall biosynthesis